MSAYGATTSADAASHSQFAFIDWSNGGQSSEYIPTLLLQLNVKSHAAILEKSTAWVPESLRCAPQQHMDVVWRNAIGRVATVGP